MQFFISFPTFFIFFLYFLGNYAPCPPCQLEFISWEKKWWYVVFLECMYLFSSHSINQSVFWKWKPFSLLFFGGGWVGIEPYRLTWFIHDLLCLYISEVRKPSAAMNVAAKRCLLRRKWRIPSWMTVTQWLNNQTRILLFLWWFQHSAFY